MFILVSFDMSKGDVEVVFADVVKASVDHVVIVARSCCRIEVCIMFPR